MVLDIKNCICADIEKHFYTAGASRILTPAIPQIIGLSCTLEITASHIFANYTCLRKQKVRSDCRVLRTSFTCKCCYYFALAQQITRPTTVVVFFLDKHALFDYVLEFLHGF